MNRWAWPRFRGVARHSVWVRVAAIALALGALGLAFLHGTPVPVHLVALLDDSASMPPAWVDQAWADLCPRLAHLPPGSRLSLVRIGTRPVLEFAGQPLGEAGPPPGCNGQGPPRRLPLSDSGTAIAAALAQVRSLLHPGEPALVLLISDGQENLGRSEPVLRNLAQDRTPVLWWNPTVGRVPADAWVRAVSVQTGPDGQAVAAVQFGAGNRGAADLLVTLDGRTAQRRPVDLVPDHPSDLDLVLGPLTPGPHLVTAEVRAPGDLRPGNDRRGAALRVPGPAYLGLIARTAVPSPVARSLSAGGWSVQSLKPADLEHGLLTSLGVLILDGITPADLSASAWSAVERAVTRDGTGMILLGGPGTFGTGGYRHSTLEGLLPVTAEAPDRSPAAAVVFAVDKSGSMAQPTRFGTTRLTLAREAVTASASGLGPKDQSAVLVFDVAAETLLSLAVHADGAQSLAQTWHPTPGGGTRLAPVIDETLALLAGEVPDQRLLVLVSDGQVTDPERAEELGQRLAAAEVQLSVLAVGDDLEGAPLRALAQAAGGRYQQVADLPELPRLMDAEVQQGRSPVELGAIRPRLTEPLPIAAPPPGPWPELLAYPVTRLRDGARAYLTAPNGDPLLAAHRAGSGLVLALPAGLSTWAPAWPAWLHWGTFLGGLVDWAAGGGEPLDASVELRPDGSHVLWIDRADPRGGWSASEPLSLLVQDPDGREFQVQAKPIAPGRYTAALANAPIGHYRILADGSGTADLWYQPDLELPPTPGTGAGLEGAAAAGLLARWSTADGELPMPRLIGQLPSTLVLAALLTFLIGLLYERLPLGRMVAFGRSVLGSAAAPWVLAQSKLGPHARPDREAS